MIISFFLPLTACAVCSYHILGVFEELLPWNLVQIFSFQTTQVLRYKFILLSAPEVVQNVLE